MPLKCLYLSVALSDDCNDLDKVPFIYASTVCVVTVLKEVAILPSIVYEPVSGAVKVSGPLSVVDMLLVVSSTIVKGILSVPGVIVKVPGQPLATT